MSDQKSQPHSAPLGIFPEIVALLSSLSVLEQKLEETLRERDEAQSLCQDLQEEINDLMEPNTWLVCQLARHQSQTLVP